MSLTLFYNDLIKQVTIVILEEKNYAVRYFNKKGLIQAEGKNP